MQHGYDQLDRPGGFSRVRIFAPLSHRDFRLLWAGMAVSLVGDYVFDIREFGMKPPSMLMIRVYPEISVRVELHGTRDS